MEEALERFSLAQESEADNRHQALEDLRFAALEQWPDKLKRMREQDINGARPCLVLDKIGQYRRQVINDTRQNLPSIRFRPVDDRSDKDTAEVLNGLARHVQDVSSAEIAHLTALDWAVTSGLGYFRILTEYLSDDSWDQDIRIARIHNPFAVYSDPHSTAPDGSDAEWGFIADDVPRKTLEKIHPKADLGGDFGPGSEGDLMRSWFSEETVRVAEYFRIERVKDEVVLLEDQSSLYGSEYKKRLEGGEQLIKVVRRRPVDRRVCQWQKITGSEVLEESEFPSSYIPVIPVIGTEFWIDGKRQLSGLVRPAKDAQRGFNYHMSVAVEISGLGPRAPFIGAAGQFEGHPEWGTANTENHAFLEYEPISSGGTLCPPPQRQQPAGPPAAMLQMAQLFEGNVQASLGMYNATVGAPSNEKSGIAIRERKNEGDVGSLHYRGNLALSMRHEGRILLEMFSRIYDTARIARIIGEDGAVDTVALDPALPGASQKTPKGQPNIHNITLGRYDVSVDIGPAYATRRQDSAQAMVEMVRAFPPLMQMAGDLVVRSQDWPDAEQLADRLRKSLPPELAEDEEGGEPQIPPQLKAQIQQGMQQYEQQLAQAQQMIQGLQQQLGEASAAAQEGQAAAKDKSGDHALKGQELQFKGQELELKAFEAETKRQELELKAQEIQSRIEQIQADTAQTQAGTLEVESVNQTLAGLIQAQQGMEAALGELAQIRTEQIAAEARQAEVNEAIGGMLQAMQEPKSIALVRDEQGRAAGAVVSQGGQAPRRIELLRHDDGELAGAE
jgi:hypothetical protein